MAILSITSLSDRWKYVRFRHLIIPSISLRLFITSDYDYEKYKNTSGYNQICIHLNQKAFLHITIENNQFRLYQMVRVLYLVRQDWWSALIEFANACLIFFVKYLFSKRTKEAEKIKFYKTNSENNFKLYEVKNVGPA